MEFNTIVGIGALVVMITLILFGVQIYVSFLITAIIGFMLIGGPVFTLNQLTTAPFNITENYMFAVIPLFIIMGELASQAGIAEASYRALVKWVGKLRGGLLMATVGASAVFGAVSSSSIAVLALNVKVALPELLKYKYDKQFSLAAIATSGILDTLIPPSTGVLIFCLLTNLSIGRALVAGIVPGIVLTLIFFITIWVYAKIYPDRLPPADPNIKVTWKEKFSALGSIWPILFLFLVIIGGIYLGIFPPTVGGAVGCVVCIIYAITHRVSWKKIFNSFWDMVLINGQIFVLVISGFIFSRLISISGLTDVLISFVENINAPPLLVMLIVMILFILISFPLDLMPLLIITLPIFFPLLTGIGFNPFVICVAFLLLGTLGELTPPIGMSVFVTASLAKVSPAYIYKSVTLWFVITFIFMWIVILFPPLTTWLPDLMYK
jgi:C4-dicarboxylate transporter, DctM subunit